MSVTVEAGRSTSVYLTAEESEALQEAVDRLGVSASAVMRIGLRRVLGLPRVTSSRIESILDELGSNR